MKSAEVKGLSTKELKDKIEADLFLLNQMKINHSISPLNNPAKIKDLRKTIARMKTELRQREHQSNKN